MEFISERDRAYAHHVPLRCLSHRRKILKKLMRKAKAREDAVLRGEPVTYSKGASLPRLSEAREFKLYG